MVLPEARPTILCIQLVDLVIRCSMYSTVHRKHYVTRKLVTVIVGYH